MLPGLQKSTVGVQITLNSNISSPPVVTPNTDKLKDLIKTTKAKLSSKVVLGC